MKSTLYVEFQGEQVTEKSIVDKAKSIWTESGNKSTDLKNLKVYIKPEENAAYYVFNDDISGSFSLV